MWTLRIMLGDFHNLTAIPAPCLGWLVINMQLTPLRQRPLTDDVETETHGALFNAGERPDFQPNAGYTFDTVLLCLLLNNLNRALTKGQLMHFRSSDDPAAARGD